MKIKSQTEFINNGISLIIKETVKPGAEIVIVISRYGEGDGEFFEMTPQEAATLSNELFAFSQVAERKQKNG